MDDIDLIRSNKVILYRIDDTKVELEYDIEYIKNRSIWLDIKILFGTVRVVLTREDAK